MPPKTIMLLVLVSAGFLLPGISRAEGWDVEIRRSFPTAKGALALGETGQGGFLVYVDGQLIRELEGFGIDVWGKLPSEDAPRYLLLGIETGNGYCQRKYRLLDVMASTTPYLTGEFADCSPVPKMQMQDQDVKIDFPSSHDVKAQEWLFDPARRELTQVH